MITVYLPLPVGISFMYFPISDYGLFFNSSFTAGLVVVNSISYACLENSLSPSFLKIILPDEISRLYIPFFHHFKCLRSLLLHFKVASEKSADNLMGVSLIYDLLPSGCFQDCLYPKLFPL